MRRPVQPRSTEPGFLAADLEPVMNPASATLQLNLDDSLVLRLLAVALERVQRRRQRPKKKGSLHRV